MHTRISIAPDNPVGELVSSIFGDKNQSSLFKALSDDAKDMAKFEQEKVSVAQNTNESTTGIQKNNAEDDKSNNTQPRSFGLESTGKVEECATEESSNGATEDDTTNSTIKTVEIEGAKESTNVPLTEDKVLYSRVDVICNLRDCAVLDVVQRVAKYASDGKNNAKGVVDAWRAANTKPLQQKAKIRCARKCKELWNQLEKQKKQVLCIRHENTHYMNNLSKQEDDRDNMLQKNSIIEEEECEFGDTGEIDILEQRPVSRMEDFFTSTEMPKTSYPETSYEEGHQGEQKSDEEGQGEQKSEPIMSTDSQEDVNNTEKREEPIELANGSQVGDQKEIDSNEELTEVKSPYGSPLTIETVCESSDGEDTIGSADVLTETEINALSMSDDICAVQRSTIDFALAIIDCDVVLVDIGLMQSLISVAETAIEGKVFKVPVPRPTQPLRRVASARTLTTKIAKRASRKMNAIQRAIAKVDKHRQRQRLIASQ